MSIQSMFNSMLGGIGAAAGTIKGAYEMKEKSQTAKPIQKGPQAPAERALPRTTENNTPEPTKAVEGPQNASETVPASPEPKAEVPKENAAKMQQDEEPLTPGEKMAYRSLQGKLKRYHNQNMKLRKELIKARAGGAK